jgi:hypothetical protein
MSKDKVWNRGKHNGRGLPQRQNKESNPEASNGASLSQDGSGVPAQTIPARVNTVQRMNRENWVQRATPMKRDGKKE